MAADRNLLFGILALQMDFISKNNLIQAMNAWILQKHKPLAQILEEQGALQPDARALLEPLVAKHLEMHGNDAQRSLAALGSVSSLQEDLKQIADPDVQASLAPLAEITQTYEGPTAPNFGNRFRILRPHAKGGLGEVFVANDQELNREVALKEIQAEYAFKPEHRSRFLLEAEITGGLEHPGIVPVYGLGSYADGRPFYAMRFIKGDSLKDAIKRFHDKDKVKRDPRERSLALRELLGRFVDVCQAIAYAHSRGVLHRDLKPGNVMLGKYGETLVVDWGLAKATRNPAGARTGAQIPAQETLAPDAESRAEFLAEPDLPSTPFAEHLLVLRSPAGPEAFTQMGQVIGTPAYMSPEQATGRLDQLGPASDVYSLGATLYHLLTGVPSIQGEDMGEVVRRVQRGDIPSPRTMAPGIPAALDAVCRKAMGLKPMDRYATAQELATEIERWLADEPVHAYREPWSVRAQRWLGRHRTAATAAAVGAVMAVVGLAVVLVLTKAGEEREKAAKNEAIAAGIEARHHLYAARMNLAQQAWEINDIGRVRQLLVLCSTRQVLDLSHNPPTTTEDLRGWEWYYQNRLCQSDLCTLEGHRAGVTSVMFSPDGMLLSSIDRNQQVKVWDLASGQEVRTRKGSSEPEFFPTLAVSPDGTTIASAGRLFGTNFAPDSSSTPDTVKLWEIGSGRLLRTIKGHKAQVTALTFTSDGSRLASASMDHTIKLWDVASGQELRTLAGHSGIISFVAFSPEGSRLASRSQSMVKLWDTTNAKELRTLPGEHSAFAFSPDGKRIATVLSHNRFSNVGLHSFKLWDTESGQELRTLVGHAAYVTAVAFSPDRSMLASASEDKTVKVWDAASGLELLTLKGHSAGVAAVAFSPDGARIASASLDNTVKVWDAVSGQESRELEGVDQEVRDLERVRLSSGRIGILAFSPDGKNIASANENGTLQVFDATSGQEFHTLKGHTAMITSVAFSPDGAKIASASEDHTVKLWDAFHGMELRTFKGNAAKVKAVAFSPDGSRLATASEDKTVKHWDATSGQELLTFQGKLDFNYAAGGLAFSPDASTIAWVRNRNTITLSDANSGQKLRDISHEHIEIDILAFSPNGSKIASSGGNGTIAVFDVASGDKLRTLIGHAARVNSVAFTSDGARIASASDDRTVKLWDVLSGQELWTSNWRTPGVTAVAFSPDDTILVSASFDGRAIKVKMCDAAPLTPFLRADREARALVEFHLSKTSAKNELLTILRTTPGRSESVRTRALALAEEYWERRLQIQARAYVENLFTRALLKKEIMEAIQKDIKLKGDVRAAALIVVDKFPEDARKLNQAAWKVASKRSEKPEAYRRGLVQAEAAARECPDEGDILRTLGVAQYRNHQNQQAMATLERSEELNPIPQLGPVPANLAFLAMCYHQLGRKADAHRTLDRLRETMKKPQWTKNEIARGFLEEAETLLAQPAAPAKK